MQKIKFLAIAILVASALAACGMNKDTTKNNADNNPATENGVTNDNDKNRDDQNVNDNNRDDNNTDGLDNGVDHNGESRLDHAEDAADKVAELDEVDSATVIITDNNAYVAVMMNNEADRDQANDDETISKELEDKIADKVREVKGDVKNVYVSLNPDFVERMRGYGERINEGEPIEGFFEEFGEAVRNVFPDAR